MKKALFFFGAFFAMFVFAAKADAASISSGDLIKASQPAVYYYAQDGKRYVFPNEKTYKTWYADFSGVKTITDAELAAISIGGNVTYKPSVKMIKIDTDPKVYAVSRGGNLRWVQTEALAAYFYGADWNKKIDDVPDAFFTNYLVGSPLASAADYNVADELAAATSINADRFVAAPTTPAPAAAAYFWNVKTANSDSYSHKNFSLSAYGSGFISVWNDDRNGQNEIFYQKMGSDGAASGDAQKVSSNITDSTKGFAASDGVNLYILWEDSSPLKRAIYFKKYDAYNNELANRLFTSSTYATSKNPDFAWNGALGEYGVVWWDTKSTLSGSSGNLYFSRMTQGGLKSGPELIIDENPSTLFQSKVIADGDKFAVVWQSDDKAIKFALINNLSAVDGGVKNIYTAAQTTEPRIAWSGSRYGAVWADKNGDNQDIYFMLLDSLGNPVGGKAAITSGAGDAVEPSIAWFGDKFYISYTNYKPNFSATGAVSDIRVIKVGIDGAAGEAKTVSTSSGKAYSSSIVANGNSVGVAWLEDSGAANKIMSAAETKN